MAYLTRLGARDLPLKRVGLKATGPLQTIGWHEGDDGGHYGEEFPGRIGQRLGRRPQSAHEPTPLGIVEAFLGRLPGEPQKPPER